MKKGNRSKILGNFFTPFFGIKSRFSLRLETHTQVSLHQAQHGTVPTPHELVHGFTIKNLLVTLLRVQIELTLHGVRNTACEVVVLHGGVLLT